MHKAKWQTPADVKADFGTASILKEGRVVFNITGNKYRLITSINYPYGLSSLNLSAHTSSTTPSMYELSRDNMDIKPIAPKNTIKQHSRRWNRSSLPSLGRQRAIG